MRDCLHRWNSDHAVGVHPFSILASWRTRGAQDRLNDPRVHEVEAEWAITVPPVLETFYRSSVVKRCEFFLVPRGLNAPRWYVAGFIPLTKVDVREWRQATGVPGLPLAIDGAKGTYYVPFEALKHGHSAPVLLREPGLAHKDTVVAPSVEDFVQFQPITPGVEEEG
jgi:hypothetical protein